ncbi:electron transport complex subunit RsxC [Alteromonas sp. a30]|uniref:electron transport complex subunit RsxC n=1 Tax=Alteromonas sp. a30 TaxID=2730917 RepID=UPI00227FF3A2|nr:electron transport complex subunit RsxC [Alteromonas sp. a30]MCY7296875.1 electron transport complex subunit RsxC [Alteromonas sp. a30]
MNSIIDRIKQNRLWDFAGGVHPKQFKSLSNKHEIAEVGLPETLYIPLKQHIGVEGKLNVGVGDKVLKGQALTHSTNPFAVPIHASTSGEIVAIDEHVSAHPSGKPETTVILKPDGLEKWCDLSPLSDYQTLPKATVVEHLCNAGISGMGGAGFPTHIKVGSEKPIHYLVINGIECEPYITSDDRLMREHAWQVRQGIDVLMHLLQPEFAIIAIEDNKPEAIQAMQVACQDADNYLVTSVPTKYPAGGEKQLIEVLTGQQIPKDKHPIDVGIVMQNVGTCFAIADAVFAGKPLIQRVVTLTGKALKAPQNVWGLIGTPISHLLEVAQYQAKKQKAPRVIIGGPMMGFTAASTKVPIVKISNCLLVPANKELPLPQDEMPCIRCGACADACPAGLLPQQLYWHAKSGELEKAQAFNLADCIECGACAFVCPSNIPLVHYYRTAKADIKIAQEEKEKSDRSKARFNARQERLEREKQEREEKRLQSAKAREQAKAAREARNQTQEVDNASQEASPQSAPVENKSDKVAAAIARAKAKKAAKNAQDDAPATNSSEKTDDNRAKESAGKSTPEPTTGQSKDERVAAAIARAKAKKAAQNAQDDAPATNSSEKTDDNRANESAGKSTPEPTTGQSKDERVAAAIARAKARKLEKEQAAKEDANKLTAETASVKEKPAPKTEVTASQETPVKDASTPKVTQKPSANETEEERQKRVAAAVAKAKARKAERDKAKAQQEHQNNSSNSGEH